MRVFKSRAYKDAELALLDAETQVEVDAVVSEARVKLTPGEFGHFLKKVLDRRAALPSRHVDQKEESEHNGVQDKACGADQ